MGEPNDNELLRDAIRTRLASGDLPQLIGSAWAGESRGDHRCVCCHRTIRGQDIEYEPRDHPDTYAHIACFTVWLSESRLAQAPRPTRSEAPPPALERAS